MGDFQIKLGWLSPDARLVECGYQAHLSVADDLVRQLGLPDKKLNDETLIEAGWIKITRQIFLGHGTRQIFLRHGARICFPYRERMAEDGFTLSCAYCSSAQKDYLRKFFLDFRDELSDLNQQEFLEAGIIDEEEYCEWAQCVPRKRRCASDEQTVVRSR